MAKGRQCTIAPVLVAVALVFTSTSAFSAGYNNASQYAQIGWAPNYTITVNGTKQTIAPTGNGIKVGVLDTGATPQWVGNVAGSITLGSCQIAGCSSSADDNGHGTFVASEIASNIPSIGLTGLANSAKILAVKVLDANGSGYSNNLANGIIYAANNGAQILNMSLGPSGTAAQQTAFYNSIASAVNYAASKGVFIVFAGGNAHQALAAGGNISGYTDNAIQHIIFAGSVNSSNALSSFSNNPGTAGFISTSNKFYSYNSMWVMADGENLWGASNYHTAQSGYSYITQMSGTSMSAPQVAAALALLESQWAILRTNGTAAQVLEQTAKDLGTKGVDSTYGSGLVNLIQAMQPVGTLIVQQSNGKSVSLSSVTGQMVLGGSFGATSNGKISSALQAILSNYTTFDGFGRNYVVNLASLVTGSSTTSPTAASVTAPKATTTGAKFSDGSSLAFGSSNSDPYDISHPHGGTGHNWFMSFTNAGGSTYAAGIGFPASASFASALWGSDNPVAGQVYGLSASSTLSNIAQGGAFFAYGLPVEENTRMAFSLSQTQTADALTGNTSSSAMAFSGGVSRRIGENITAGLTLGVMDQQNGMLDATYSGNAMSLGNNHKSISLGATASYALSDKEDLVFDAAIVRTNGGNVSQGFITGTSTLYARSFGVAYNQRDAIETGDALNISVKEPLKVISGSATMLTTSVDGNGLPVTVGQRVGLTPDGNEVDFTMGYESATTDLGFSWNMTLEGRHDAGNVAGENDATFLSRAKLNF